MPAASKVKMSSSEKKKRPRTQATTILVITYDISYTRCVTGPFFMLSSCKITSNKCTKKRAALAKIFFANSWFSHDVTKIPAKKLTLLLSFYFHVILEHLKTFIQTNFRF